jgi:predicted GNAT family N-acyltransferase
MQVCNNLVRKEADMDQISIGRFIAAERKRKGTSGQRIFGSAESVPSDTK